MASRVEEISESLSSRVDEIAGSLSLIRDAVATCSSQCSYLEIAPQQLVDDHAARSDASRDVGDVRERLMQKSQLSVDAVLWNNTSSRRHWLIGDYSAARRISGGRAGLRGEVGQRHVTRGWSASVSQLLRHGPVRASFGHARWRLHHDSRPPRASSLCYCGRVVCRACVRSRRR